MKDLDLGVTKMKLEFQVRYKYEGYVVEQGRYVEVDEVGRVKRVRGRGTDKCDQTLIV